ncbi:hypothetical protein BJF86_08800 [Serinicoccus sp. CNJ-927]|uniref:hypothetical protein n=1 Tax=Serinicoccus sp. CNJ-927 TaxID=1904970 RepID=UPI000962A4BF|nr:hypothetical protein [Serinicoccus sp. CNJ-927]OLT39495.1 hypothetical protein BJF86_08800 [Serinicoccus sp. CNJ-927]
MKPVLPGSIERALEGFLGRDGDTRASPRRRERSWDLCYCHFQDHPEPTKVMETSCLHLGYYLASWGMLRGSSFLFHETNALHYQAVIGVIEKHNKALRGWDVPDYVDTARFEAFNAAWDEVRAALIPADRTGLTLVSKVMMGVWGCIPSFDTFFVQTFKGLSKGRTESGAWNRAGADALGMLHDVWVQHKDEIERVRAQYPVWDFTTGSATERQMPVAKVLDTYGFYESWKR